MVTSTKVKGQRSYSLDDKGGRRTSRVYQVICDDRADGADVACDACPAMGERYKSDDPDLVVRGVSAEEGDRTGAGGVVYLVTVDYSTETAGGSGKDPDQKLPDPTARPGQLRLSFATQDETFWQIQKGQIPEAEDADGAAVLIAATWKWGNAIATSAGTPYKDGLKETVYDAVYTFEKNVTTSSWVEISDTLDAYAGSVNSDDFAVDYRGESKRFAKGTVLLASPTSESGYENGVAFERVTVQLMVRKDGWKHKVLDQGVRWWSGTGTAGTPSVSRAPDKVARDPLGQETSEPVFLDGKGKRLADAAKPVFLKFPRRKGEKPFRALGFDEFG